MEDVMSMEEEQILLNIDIPPPSPGPGLPALPLNQEGGAVAPPAPPPPVPNNRAFSLRHVYDVTFHAGVQLRGVRPQINNYGEVISIRPETPTGSKTAICREALDDPGCRSVSIVSRSSCEHCSNPTMQPSTD